MNSVHDFLIAVPVNEELDAELIVKSSKGIFKLSNVRLVEGYAESEDEMTLVISAHNESVKIEKLIG